MKPTLISSGVLAGLAAGVLLALSASAASAHNLGRVHPAARWATSTERAIDANLEYPSAVRLRQARSAEVAVNVAADGRLGEPVVTRSTGIAALDEAAVDAVRRTRFVPAPPAALADRPIVYQATFEAPATRPTR